MKRPVLALTLSFFLPGAGLAYLGKWKWAAINLGAVLLVGVVVGWLVPEDVLFRFAQPVAIGIGGGSGGLAYSLAQQMNQKEPGR